MFRSRRASALPPARAASALGRWLRRGVTLAVMPPLPNLACCRGSLASLAVWGLQHRSVLPVWSLMALLSAPKRAGSRQPAGRMLGGGGGKRREGLLEAGSFWRAADCKHLDLFKLFQSSVTEHFCLPTAKAIPRLLEV